MELAYRSNQLAVGRHVEVISKVDNAMQYRVGEGQKQRD
jgi:hypothetical protein